MVNKRFEQLKKEKFAKIRYGKYLKVLNLLKFLTRVEIERLHLSEEEFEDIEFGMKYFCIDYVLIFKIKKSLMDVNITKEEYDVQVNFIK